MARECEVSVSIAGSVGKKVEIETLEREKRVVDERRERKNPTTSLVYILVSRGRNLFIGGQRNREKMLIIFDQKKRRENANNLLIKKRESANK